MSELNGIAIVGMAGRFPGAKNVPEFWANLVGGVESISFFTKQEMAESGVPAALIANPGYVAAAAVLPDVDRFDAGFFGFTPREAALLDPQSRLFMECVWEALEDAGLVPDRFDGLIGVFGGAGASRYFMRNVLPASGRLDGAGAYQAMIANDKDFMPSWVSYKLDLRGPSVAVQTSCSTSLVAVHMACQSLLTYQCDVALAGGVSLGLDRKAGYLYQDGGILSPDGHCRPFDASAQGTVHGSGAGVVALRRLEDAVADGDAIVAVIKGSAINNDGAVKVGFTAPGVEGQAEVIAMAQAVAGVDADSIEFVEAHGTATPLGDPVEVAALTRIFRRQTLRRAYCALGSVKSNIGHLDAAAGIAGLIKAALAVERGSVPPTLHFREPNPHISLGETPFYVNADVRAWPDSAKPRRAAVSSFGIGGTNAHLVLEQAPVRRVSGPSRSWQILALSARTLPALDRATDGLADALCEPPEAPLADTACTLLTGRKAFEHRRVVVCESVSGALDAIDADDPARVFTGVASASPRPVTLMFPGQGSQHVDMARDLYQQEPVFRTELDRCASIVRSTAGFDLTAVLFPSPAERERSSDRLDRTDLCQLALFSVEFALARFIASLGVQARSFIGHSIGEYVAACLAGVFTLEDALGVVAARGRLMAGMPPGDMLAVSASEAQVKSWIDPGRLSIAVVNSPAACVVAGPAAAVAELAAALEDRGVLHRRLHVSHAFHSHMMDAALPPFRAVMSRVALRPPRTPFISNVTGTWIRPDEATDPEYWVRQLRRTVYFADGLREVLRDPHGVCVEVGPGRTLQGLALQQRERGSRQEIVALLPDVRDRRSCAETLAAAMGRLWIAGADVEWARYFEGETRNRVHLPTYPFERERHWIDPPPSAAMAHDTGRRDFSEWFYVPVWKQAPMPPVPGFYHRPRSWLILGDRSWLAAGLADALVARGQKVTIRAAGDALPDDRSAPDRVICLSTAFAALLRIVQALGERVAGQRLVLDVIQTGVQSVTGDELLEPENASVLGLCRVVGQEISEIRCRHIDLVATNDDVGRTRTVDQLLHEFAIESQAGEVAYRGRFRWTLDYERVDRTVARPPRLRERGVYWITGGTGGVGLALAEHLSATRQARLVLSSRRSLSSNDPRRERIRRMEELGSEVLLIQADVSSREEMQRAASEVHARFGEVHGAIHAAGIPGGRLIALQTEQGADAVMAPKVRGAINLEHALDRFHPDFVLYCSSLAVQIGGLGQADYAGANAFLGALARERAARGGRLTVAVDWDRWRDLGMAAASGGAEGIDPEEGARALETILGWEFPQVTLSSIDLRSRLAAGLAEAPAAATETHPRPKLSTDYVTPATQPEAALAALWREILGLGQVGIDDNFFELGGDSLSALRFTALYQERANVSLPVTALYAAPTIRRLLASATEGAVGGTTGRTTAAT